MDIQGTGTTRSDGNCKNKTENILSKENCNIINDNEINRNKNIINCFYTNADVLYNKLDELKIRLNEDTSINYDIIGITETNYKNIKDKPNILEYNLVGYDIFHNDTLDTKIPHRGIILYIKKNLKATQISFVNSCFNESIWVSIDLKFNETLLIGCIYRSPNSNDNNNSKLIELINEVSNSKFSKLLIMGDFNFPNIDWKLETCSFSNGAASNFLENIKDNFLCQHIMLPTRGRYGQNTSLLDLILTNDEDIVKDVSINSPLGKSDHSVIKFKLFCDAEIDDEFIPKLLFDKGDYESMRSKLDLIDWSQVLLENEETNVDTQWNIFKDIYNDIVATFVPIKTNKNETSNKKGKYNKEILTAVKKKHRLWQRFIETKSGEKYIEYAKARNKAKGLIRSFQTNINKKIAQDIKTNPKRFWAYVNSKTKSKGEIPNLKTDDDRNITENNSEKAEVLANFFSSVFVSEPDGEIPEQINHGVSSISNIHISEERVKSKLNNLNVSKSCGPDLIHPRVLKELSQNFALPLSIIFITSLETGTLPQDWKMANVTAIYKKDEKNIANNYRPISLTSIVCKILESIIRDDLVDYLKLNNMISNKQFGFLKGRSTTLQMINVLDEWSKIIDSGGNIDVIYTDFQKAFDSVPHKRLFEKLKSFGFCGNILNWIKSFLTGRMQRVVVKGDFSHWMNVLSGVPQGSVLGPLLFLLYINDIVDNLKCNTYLFADDMKIFNKISNQRDIDVLQNDFDTVVNWTSTWLLKLNKDKCKILNIRMSSLDIISKYYLSSDENSCYLKNSTCEKDLGILVDKELNFEDHIMDKIKKANKILGLIRRSFIHLDQKSFLILYKTLVRSQLEYAQTVWSPHKNKFIEAIERVQKRATKILPGLRNLSYEDRLKKLELPTLAYRRSRGDMIEAFKMLNGHYDQDAIPKLQLSSNTNTRGNDKKLFMLSSKKNIRKYSFCVRIIEYWNTLPNDIINASSVNSFKNKLDKFWYYRKFLY